MVVQIVKSLSRFYEYVIYLNNFFSSIDLFMILKALEVEAVGTAKQNSEFDENLLRKELGYYSSHNSRWSRTMNDLTEQQHCFINDNDSLAWESSKNRSQRFLIQTSYFWRLRSARFRKQPNFTLFTSSDGLQFTHGGSRRKCSAKETIFLRQTSMSTLLVISVSVSFRCSCSECLHPLQAQLSYKQDDTCSISEEGGYFADAKFSWIDS